MRNMQVYQYIPVMQEQKVKFGGYVLPELFQEWHGIILSHLYVFSSYDLEHSKLSPFMQAKIKAQCPLFSL